MPKEPKPLHECGNPIAEYPRHRCTDWSAHSLQPEHAGYSGWSCYVCNGPCREPTSLLPRCGDAGNEWGVPCDLHEGHKWPNKHVANLRWGDTSLSTS